MYTSIPTTTVESSFSQVPWFIRLQAAIIRRAAVDWVLYKHSEVPRLKRYWRDAAKWVFSPKEESKVGSFVSICGHMGIDPSIMRGKITNMTEETARRLRGMEFGDDH